MFFVEDFDQLATENPNFSGMSSPCPASGAAGDDWKGYKGFIHNVCSRNTSRTIQRPRIANITYCGPPIMNQSVINMLVNLGVDRGRHHAG